METHSERATAGASGGCACAQLQPHGGRPGGGHLRGICILDHPHDAGGSRAFAAACTVTLCVCLGHDTRAITLISTAALVQAATDVRKQVNVLDNQTTGKAVDALLNYETVALFNNQVSSTACSRAPASSS